MWNNDIDFSVACGLISSGIKVPAVLSNAAPLDFRNNIVYDAEGHQFGTIYKGSPAISASDNNVWFNIAAYGSQAFKDATTNQYYYFSGTCPSWTFSPAANSCSNRTLNVTAGNMTESGSTITATVNTGYQVNPYWLLNETGNDAGYNCTGCVVLSIVGTRAGLTYSNGNTGLSPSVAAATIVASGNRLGTAFDTHSSTGNPAMNSSNQLGPGSSAIGPGAELDQRL